MICITLSYVISEITQAYHVKIDDHHSETFTIKDKSIKNWVIMKQNVKD